MAPRLGVPARERAMEGIRFYILDKGFKGGDRLPAERELAQICGVSRTALRSAITQMVARNELVAKPGSGNYLRMPRPVHVFQNTYNYSESVQRAGQEPGAFVVKAAVVPADAKVAANLEVAAGAPVFELQRVRTADGEPVSLETVYLDSARFPGIEAHDFSDASLYGVLEDEYGLRVRHGEERISITRVTAEEAELLDVAEGTPVYFQQAVERDGDRRPVEYSKHVVRSDRYRYASNELPRELSEEVGWEWLLR